MKLLKRLDPWIGKHMSAQRWMLVYLAAVAIGGKLMWRGWIQTVVGVVLILVGCLGVYGHARRL